MGLAGRTCCKLGDGGAEGGGVGRPLFRDLKHASEPVAISMTSWEVTAMFGQDYGTSVECSDAPDPEYT